MKRIQWVKLFAATLFAGVVGFAALKVAQATPPRGVTPTLLAGPVELDKFNTGGETDDWELEIKSKGVTDAEINKARRCIMPQHTAQVGRTDRAF